eukprot:403377009
MSSETDKKEESKQPGFMQLIEDNSMLVDEESGLKQLQDNPQVDQNNYNSQQQYLTNQHSNELEEQKIIQLKKNFRCKVQSTHFQEIQQIQAKEAELLQMKEKKFIDVDLEQQNTNRSDNDAKQSNIYFQETDGASGMEMKRLINQEGDQDSSQAIFNLPSSQEETFLCQVCYYDIKESRAFDCTTCLATSSQNKICNYCMLGYLQETTTQYLQADVIVIKCPLNTCGKKINFEQTLNHLLKYQSYNAQNKGSHYSSAEEGLNFQEAYKQLESTLFERFKIQNKDFKYCPAKDCVYGGFKDKKYCTDNFVCEKCAFTWRDLSTMSNCDKLKITCKQTRYCHQYLLSQMHHLFFEKTCPNCGIYIQKNGGCVHMTCYKCKYEFCWLCKNKWSTHTSQRSKVFCILHLAMKALITVICLIFFDIKVIQFMPAFRKFQEQFLEYFAMALYADLFIFTYIICEMRIWRRYSYNVRTFQEKIRKNYKVLVLLQIIRFGLNLILFSFQEMLAMLFLVIIQLVMFGLVLLSIGLYKRYLNYKKWRIIQRRLEQQRQERIDNLVVDTTRMTDLQLKIYLDQQELKQIMNRIQVAQNGGPESKVQIYNHREAEESDYHRYALKSVSPINKEIQAQIKQKEGNIIINNEQVLLDINYEQDNYTKANEDKFQMYALPPEIRDIPQYMSRCSVDYPIDKTYYIDPEIAYKYGLEPVSHLDLRGQLDAQMRMFEVYIDPQEEAQMFQDKVLEIEARIQLLENVRKQDDSYITIENQN